MSKSFYILAAFFAIILFSCKNTPADKPEISEEKTSNPISFETKSFERKRGECKELHVKCIVIKINYPLAKEGNEKTRNSINTFVKNMILESIIPDPDENIKDFDTAAKQLTKYYQEQVDEFPDYEMGWEIDVDGSAEIIDNYAIITLPTYSNMGGAHPNHFTSIANFDLITGVELRLMDFVKDAKAFKELAQKRFIDARTKDYDLGEANIEDFFFGDGFQLPENFAVKKEGIFFYYNPYEAAPYALGTTEFTISYKDLEGIVKL